MRILVVEDDAINALIFLEALRRGGYTSEHVTNGEAALARLQDGRFDAIVTDWNMPKMDGIALIRAIRESIKPSPPIIMVTAIDHPAGKTLALESGADDFLAKPIVPATLLQSLGNLLRRRADSGTTEGVARSDKDLTVEKRAVRVLRVPGVAVAVAASTGGPNALVALLEGTSFPEQACYFIVQHGPPWMLEALAERLCGLSKWRVELATDNAKIELGRWYVAPGDKHLRVLPSMRLSLDGGEPVNFVRPAADVLFASLAQCFGSHVVACVHTGVGRDGAAGARAIADAGGHVIVPEPSELVAPYMAKATQTAVGRACRTTPLRSLGTSLADRIRKCQQSLSLG